MLEGLNQNQDFFSLLLGNDEIKKEVLEIFAEEIYRGLESERAEKTDCGKCLCKDGGLGLKKNKVYVQSGMYLRGQKWPLLCYF